MNIGGLKLKAERKKRGMSLKILYDLTGISEASLSRIENGEKIPDENEIALLAGSLRLEKNNLKLLFQHQRDYEVKNELLQNINLLIPVLCGLNISSFLSSLNSETQAMNYLTDAIKDMDWIQKKLDAWIDNATNIMSKYALLAEKNFVLWNNAIFYSDMRTAEFALKSIEDFIECFKKFDETAVRSEAQSMLIFKYQGHHYFNKKNQIAIRYKVTDFSILSEPLLNFSPNPVYESTSRYIEDIKLSIDELIHVKNTINTKKIRDPYAVMWGGCYWQGIKRFNKS